MSSSDSFGIPSILQSQVEAELQPGEHITWLDQPAPGRVAHSALPIAFFGIPSTLFSLLWMGGAMLIGGGFLGWGGVCFGLFGLPFLAIGVGMLASPYWMPRLAARTVYALTNRRAIIIKSGIFGGLTVQSYGPDQLTELQRKQYPDGTGNLVFSQTSRRDMDGRRHITTIGFMAVRDVKDVEDRVHELVRQHENAG